MLADLLDRSGLGLFDEAMAALPVAETQNVFERAAAHLLTSAAGEAIVRVDRQVITESEDRYTSTKGATQPFLTRCPCVRLQTPNSRVEKHC